MKQAWAATRTENRVINRDRAADLVAQAVCDAMRLKRQMDDLLHATRDMRVFDYLQIARSQLNVPIKLLKAVESDLIPKCSSASEASSADCGKPSASTDTRKTRRLVDKTTGAEIEV